MITFPAERPAGLKRHPIRAGTDLWRIDKSEPATWTWAGFATPCYRFDPTSGAFRTRYAGTRRHGAARERYAGTCRVIPAAHADDHLVHLRTTRSLRVLDLRGERTQDLLGVDDQINTSRSADHFAACQDLADAAPRWWDDLDGILYRSRTTPQDSTNLAFWSLDGFEVDATRLGDATEFLADLVLHRRFTVDFAF